MLPINENRPFVHWYYSVSEWEEFMKQNNTRKGLTLFIASVCVWIVIFMIIRISGKIELLSSLEVSTGIALLYGILSHFTRMRSLKWKGLKMPEVVIANGRISVNGKSTIFHGNDTWLRKAIIKESNNINILGIAYERKSGDGIYFDEISIPVPRGKLRDAMELLDNLNLKIDILTVFS